MSFLPLVLALAAWGQAQPSAQPTEAQKSSAAAPARKAEKVPLPPVATLDLAVTDPAGKPVDGALAMAVPVQEALLSRGAIARDKVRSALTGRDGQAKLESLPPGPWNVVVHARGFVTWSLRRAASGPLAVRLEKGGSITGVVREGRERRPVPGARVSVSRPLPVTGGWEDEAARDETTTDAQGRFRLDGIGRSPVGVVARAPGFDEAQRDARAGETVEIFLFPGATLAGTVRDDDGRPVKGAVVWAEGDRPRRGPPTERTDARGEFRMSGVRPGEYTVVAREGGRAPGVAAVLVEPEGEARVSIVLSDGGFATGRVVDPEERPLAGRLRVEVVDEHGLPSSVSDAMAADAKADGTFALGPLPVATLRIAVSAPRYATRTVEATIAGRGRTVDLGDVALETGLAIRGRVRDGEGNGVDGASVRVRLQRSGERHQGEASSDADGAYVVAGLKPGTYDLTASRPGFAPAHASALAGGDPVDLVMAAGGEIAGRVVDGEGRPVEDATLGADPMDETGPRGFGTAFGIAGEGEGRFVLRDVAAGRYVLQARASGRGEASIAGVRVVAGKRTEVGTLRLSGGGVIRGTVVDQDGQGIPGATVSAERDPNMQSGELVAQTASTGSFEIRGVPAGRLSVGATHPAFAPAKAVVAEVEPDKEATAIRFVLRSGARVEGRATHRDGRPFVSGLVRAAALDAEGVADPRSPVGPDGSFVIEHVLAGRTLVEFLAPTTPGALTGLASREVVLPEGETATVDFSMRDVLVAGSVTRGGQPAPGVRVSVRSLEAASSIHYGGLAARALVAAPGPPFLVATTQEDGRYELVVFSPGRARVSLDSVAGDQRYPGREVLVPDGDRFELDLEIADATVSGTVVDQENGAPVPRATVSLRRSSAQTGPDGRFSMAVEPGEYQLEAAAPRRRRTVLPLSVGPSGLSDVRVEMESAVDLRGRVVDSVGQPVRDLEVVAADEQGEYGGVAYTLADGSFSIDGLGAQPYTLVAGGFLPGWAVRGGVVPGDEPVTLALLPGGRIAVRALDAAGLPVKNAYPEVQRVGGLAVAIPGGTAATDANGFVEVGAPAGLLDVAVSARGQAGRGTVTVRAGETSPLSVVMQQDPPKKP